MGSIAVLVLRATVPLLWIPVPFLGLKIRYYFPSLFLSFLLSLFLQPLCTILAFGSLFVCLYVSYSYRRPFKPFELQVDLTGDDTKPILFFIHGWPDCADVWQKIVPTLSERYLCATVSLPLYKASDYPEGLSDWGYDFDQVVDCMVLSLRKLLATHKQKKAVVIGHDWGSVISGMLARRFPGLCSKLVLLDVVLPPDRNVPIEVLMVMGVVYQYWLIALFLMDKLPLIGRALATMLTKHTIRNLRNQWKGVSFGYDFQASGNYLYFYYHLRELQTKLGMCRPFDDRHGIPKSTPRFPQHDCLFLYAADKGVNLHGEGFSRYLKRREASKVVSIGEKGKTKIGHWIQWRASQIVSSEIAAWIGDGEFDGDQKA